MPIPAPKIVIVGGDLDASEFPVKPGENRIGRVSENEIVIRDRSISRRHAVIRSDHEEFTIEDLGSYNGIEINGQKVRQLKLSNGMRFRLGNFDMIFVFDAPAGDAKTQSTGSSNLALIPSSGAAAAAPGNWKELFQQQGPKAPPEQAPPKEAAAADMVDLFDERPSKDTITVSAETERRRRLGLIAYLAVLVLVVAAGLLLLNIQTKSRPWEDSRDFIMKKGEKRVYQFYNPYDDFIVDDPQVIKVEPIKFMRKKEGEPRLFVLAEAVGSGTSRLVGRPAGETIRIIVQGAVSKDPTVESEQWLTAEQRLQMGALLLRSGELKQKENNLAEALKDFNRAERILLPVRTQDPLHAEARRKLRACQDLAFERIEKLKDDYYSARTSNPGQANLALEHILELIPDPADPEYQLTHLILDYRRSR